MTTDQTEILCPKCKKPMRTAFVPTIRVQQHPELRDKLLSEEFFRCTCKHCGYEGSVLSRCLYHDEKCNFMIFLVPDFDGTVLLDAQIERSYPEMTGVRKRVTNTVNRMKEKILLFEAGVDDRAIELTKVAVAGLAARKQGKKVREVYFCELDEVQHQIGFSFFFDEDTKPFVYHTRSDLYAMSREIVAKCAPDEQPGFANIDVRWAARTLAEYHRGTVQPDAEE